MGALTETLSGSAGGVAGLATRAAIVMGGLAAAFKMHESVDADERAIILNGGRVKVDREKLEKDFGTKSVRKAQKFVTKAALEQGATKKEAKHTQLDRTEYAAIYGAGGHFVFFSLRSIRKIKTTHETTLVPEQNLQMKLGKNELDARVTWKVDASGQHPARAILRARNHEELTQGIVSKVAGAARESILDMDDGDEETRHKSATVFEEIKARCGDDLIQTYGAVLLGYEIIGLAESEAETGRKIIFEGTDGRHIEPEEAVQAGLRLLRSHDATPDTGA